jgi:hypothetical protein
MHFRRPLFEQVAIRALRIDPSEMSISLRAATERFQTVRLAALWWFDEN